MRFWDSSALVSYIAEQDGFAALAPIAEDAEEIILWWATPVELVSAACRLHRHGLVDEGGLTHLMRKMKAIVDDAHEISPTEEVREAAQRVLRIHDLRTADALQLGAALMWVAQSATQTEFVCLDKRLREAAFREGFDVLPKL